MKRRSVGGASAACEAIEVSSPQRAPLVGIWRLTQLLHAGRWTELFAAQPVDAAGSPRSDYVVKRARSDGHEAAEAAAQVRTEGAAAAAIRHPNVIPLLDSGLEASQPYLVMPRLDGTTLRGWIDRGARQPLPVALWWARQCAEALSAVHAAGWLHRDLKPENLMVSPRGHLTLIDLGLAARLGAPAEGLFRGTPDYAAPEMRSGAAVIAPAADIYSLGCLLQELLQGAVESAPAAEEVLGLLEPWIARMTASMPAERPSASQVAPARRAA